MANPDWFQKQGGKGPDALHSVSHALIKTLAVHAGVSVSMLRERIYTTDMYNPAILLYIATGDRIGTLGGLSSLAEDPQLLVNLYKSAVDSMRWCALDPHCNDIQNGSCHHCLYLPETSCDAPLNEDGYPGAPNSQLSRKYLRV